MVKRDSYAVYRESVVFCTMIVSQNMFMKTFSISCVFMTAKEIYYVNFSQKKLNLDFLKGLVAHGVGAYLNFLNGLAVLVNGYIALITPGNPNFVIKF